MDALIWANQEGHATILEALLQAGADVDKAANNGCTALMVASKKGHGAIVEALLKAGADVDKAADSGTTALMMASKKVMVLQALLKAGLMAGCRQCLHSSDDGSSLRSLHHREAPPRCRGHQVGFVQ